MPVVDERALQMPHQQGTKPRTFLACLPDVTIVT
jgi:hypothetical protein